MIEAFLTNFSETHRILIYVLIFFLMLVEGEVLLMLAGILSRNGYLDFLVVLSVAFLGSVVHDFLYWRIGRRLREMDGKFFGINAEKAKIFFEKFKGDEGWRIFASKFALSFTRLFLIGNGYAGMAVERILKYTIPAGFIWVASLIGLGYVFADQFDILKKDVKTGLVFISALIIFIFVVEYLLRRAVKTEDGKSITT